MSASPPQILAESCRNATTSLSTALQAVLECRLNIDGQEEEPSPSGWPEDPSLMLVAKGQDDGFILTINNAEGFLPNWLRDPDQEGRRKLSEFGSQVASILTIKGQPREFLGLGLVDNLRSHMELVEDVDEILRFAYEITSDEKKSRLCIYWPISKADGFVSNHFTKPNDRGNVDSIPPYGKSLLQVRIPMRVALANSRTTLESIMDIGQGSIIQFDKRFDQPLILEIDRRPIATGNAVKVGDKFGFRVASICKPRERFLPVESSVEPSKPPEEVSEESAQAAGPESGD